MKAAYCLLALALLTGTAAAAKLSANERLYFRAQDGDAAAQLTISHLLLTGRFRIFKERGNPQDEGVKFLYLAAMHDNAQAKERMAVLAREGKFGVAKSPAAAACWAGSAQGTVAVLQCVEMSKLTRPRARPACSEVTQLGAARSLTAADGASMARLCIANRTLALFVPGGPPSNDTEILITEFEKHGIEYVVTGDVYEGDFEAFRAPFNTLMKNDISARMGEDIFRQVTSAAQAEIEKQALRR